MNHPEQLIRTRRSVRTFSERELDPALLERVRGLLARTDNPWDVPVVLRLLEARPNGLRSAVLLNEAWYVAAKAPKVPNFEQAVGFVLEGFCLRALELGLGTVMLGGTLNRDAFERAAELGPDERMPVASPVGFPAEKMSLRERAMRAGISADRRLPFGELFFRERLDCPLDAEQAGPLALPLELVHLAPSAANRQPWRVVVSGQEVRFYLRRGKLLVSERAGDLQKVDLGIALCHFLLGCEAAGLTARLLPDESRPSPAPDLEFCAVCVLTEP